MDLSQRITKLHKDMSYHKIGLMFGVTAQTVLRAERGEVSKGLAQTAARILGVKDWRLLLPKQRTS